MVLELELKEFFENERNGFNIAGWVSFEYLLFQEITETGKLDPFSLHAYLYCSNNPVNWIDPFGYDKAKPKISPLLIAGTAYAWGTPWPGDEEVMTAILIGTAIYVGTATTIHYFKEHRKKRPSMEDKHTKPRPGRPTEKKRQRPDWRPWGSKERWR